MSIGPQVFKCDQCTKEFNEEWKMKAHTKKHKRYQCEQCEKTFEYLDIKKKYVLIYHENNKLYCHFFNNGKTCPYAERCVFMHEASKFCRYDGMCERELCMFKHRKEESKSENIFSSDNVNDELDNIIDLDDSEDEIENEATETTVNDCINGTFLNPSQTENPPQEKMFICEKCNYKADIKI